MSQAAPDTLLTRLLDERARRLAEVAGRSEERELLYEVALVRVGSQCVGVPAGHIREIAPLTVLTRLPSQPAMLCGLTQLRGELMSVIDGGALLEASDAQAPRFAVVIEGEPGAIVLAVEAVEGFRAVYADEVVDGLEGTSRPVLAATRDLVSVLDVARMLELDGIRVRETR